MHKEGALDDGARRPPPRPSTCGHRYPTAGSPAGAYGRRTYRVKTCEIRPPTASCAPQLRCCATRARRCHRVLCAPARLGLVSEVRNSYLYVRRPKEELDECSSYVPI
ncbi:hypothetical protein EVAR_13677_1 [Eumeta japonica]|uniref:Uncharacterized protein n=1 Tax=Eumeta variegata TaxID=151549 RepID=A0A4C1UCP3_EUMVA|nr:hypothetical protein EVAR_13677_1 [Eumeta japonica]